MFLVLALVAETSFIIGKLYNEKTYKVYKKPDVYIMELTKKTQELYDCIGKRDIQLHWMKRQLSNCILLIEQQEQLLEIECKTSAGDIPPRKINLELNLPFYKQYSAKDCNLAEKSKDEFTVNMLTASLTSSINCYQAMGESTDDLINCYEKRLEQIGQHYELNH